MVVRVYVCVCVVGGNVCMCVFSPSSSSLCFLPFFLFAFFLYLVVGVYLIFILKQMIAWLPSWLLVGNDVLGMF